MNHIVAASGAAAFALYALAAMLLPQECSRRRSGSIAAVAALALALQAVAIGHSGSYWPALAGAIPAGAGIVIAVVNRGNRLAATGFTIAAATLLSLFTPPDHSTVGIHLLLTYIACGFFSMAAIQAIMIAIQEQHLRSRRPGWALRWLAPLNEMERLLFEQITLGFFTLSLGLVAGMAAQYEMLGTPAIVRKMTLSVMVWLTFGALLWGRWYRGWRAQTAVLWTLGGCTILGMAYVASHLATSGGSA